VGELLERRDEVLGYLDEPYGPRAVARVRFVRRMLRP
jgi:DNA polymerase III alpha subunit